MQEHWPFILCKREDVGGRPPSNDSEFVCLYGINAISKQVRDGGGDESAGTGGKGEGAGEGSRGHADKYLLPRLFDASAKTVQGCQTTLLSSSRGIQQDP